jgi:NitT/TauT family transport system substrate-binding protein
MEKHRVRLAFRSGLMEAVAICLLLIACVPAPAPVAPGAATPKLTQIKVGRQPFIGNAPIFIAQDEGYFAKHGIKAEFVDIKSSDEIVPLLMQGELDMSPFAIYPGFFNGVAKGGPARAVFGASRWDTQGCVAVGLVARPAESDRLKDDANWKGITISTDPVGLESMLGFFIARVLAQHGLTLADVQTVKLPPASTIDALQSGSVSLAQVNEPWLTRITDQTDAVMVAPAVSVVPNGQLSVIGFGPRLLQDADLGRRVALAFLEGVRQYQTGKTPRNVEILAKHTKLDPDLINRMCWPTIASDGSANLESIMAFQEWAVTRGLLDAVIAPDRFWDGRFAELK